MSAENTEKGDIFAKNTYFLSKILKKSNKNLHKCEKSPKFVPNY